MATVIVITGDQKGDYYPLGCRTNVVGRDPALPIQILDESVSRKHLQIHFDKDNGTYSAVDMQSKHGVLVNGRKIEEETQLYDGRYITIGHTNLLFTLKDFSDRDSALHHFKKVSERSRPTVVE